MRFFFNPLSGQVNAGPPREIVYADTAPQYPLEGSRWFDTINLREYVYTGKEWVESGVGPAGVKGDTGDKGDKGDVGPIGPVGPVGPAATVAVGTVTTGAAGTNASISNSGTSGAAVLNFTIPQGAKGETGAIGPVGPQGSQGVKGDVGNTGPQGIQGLKGDKGDTGAVGPVGPVGPQGIQGLKGDKGDTGAVGAQGLAGTSVVLKGSVAQVANLPTTGNTAGDLWVVTATGDGHVWSSITSSWSNVGPIRGPVGPAGATGAVGPAGTAATVSVGTTTTGAAGTNAAVTNSGTTSAAVFNFTVPRGNTGATGATGAVGPQGPQGIKGDTGNTGAQGPAGPAPAGTGAVVVSNGVLGTPVGYGAANTINTLVQRDGSGNFSAGTITANLTGNASGSSSSCTGNAATATKLATARAINVSGDVTGTAQDFDGSTAITIPTAIAAGVIVNADINAAAAIVDTKLATISTAGKVSNSATTATSANTASAIVARDANGNFTATTITAALSGNATSASSAAKLTTARKINGVDFDGSSDITISAAPTAHNHDASNINAGTLANDRLPARLQATPQTITDWNNALENGWYQGANAANAPEGVLDWWLGYVEAHWDRWVTQTVHLFTHDAPTNTHIWRRSSADAGPAVRTWGPWYKLQLSQAEQDARYPLANHTHDDRYYTETETNTLLAGKSNTGHTHDAFIPSKTSSNIIANNGDNLANKYNEAKTLTPNGLALSSTNRATLLIMPGSYTISATLNVDTEFVDIIGMEHGRREPNVYIAGSDIQVTANNVRIIGIGLISNRITTINSGTSRFFQNCYASSSSFGFGSANPADGTYFGCVCNAGVSSAFGGGISGTASGTFFDCRIIGSGGGFGHGGASGFFEECSSTSNSFGGGNNYTGGATGTFLRCRATGSYTFGGSTYVLTSGRFVDCEGGSNSFGAAYTTPSGPVGGATGTFIRCIARGNRAFGFGSNDNTGRVYNCIIENNGSSSFATFGNGLKIRLSIDGGDTEININ